MTTYDWPTAGTDKAFMPKSVEPKRFHNGRELKSTLSGDIQTQSVPGAYVGWVFNFASQTWAERERLWALLSQLDGNANRVRLFDHHRPTPRGTCNLSGVTASAAAQFATSITLNGCGAAKTLLRGDWFNPGGQQLVQAVADATANGSGVLTVEFRNPLRAAVTGGASVTLDHATGLFILTTPDIGNVYAAGDRAPDISIEFREVFA